MDPKQTIIDLLDSIDRNDRERVDELLNALSEWNTKGGFLPSIPMGRSPAGPFYYIPSASNRWH